MLVPTIAIKLAHYIIDSAKINNYSIKKMGNIAAAHSPLLYERNSMRR